ncbi:MAG: DUF4301 family protein, partial [Flavobacteriales bacterium]|nr:DUF4301 family protein [Flavobacteriales bacterium]
MQTLINKMMKAGIPEDLAQEQIRLMQRGTRYCDIVSFASIGNGIIALSDDEVNRLSRFYDNRTSDVKILKFVPASGAATRMFKALIKSRADQAINQEAQVFFENITEFPFSEYLDLSLDQLSILDQLLAEDRLNMDAMPKGSILFHKYENETRTAFEEHLVEGVDYATSGGMVHIHFTIAPEAMEKIKKDMRQWSEKYSKRLGCKYDLEFSIQLPSTDTVPFDLDLAPLENKNGVLLTRPGGHGSLIHNLNRLKADIIFIKNVDNVVPDKNRRDTILYKKVLAGLLMEVRNEARRMISLLKAEDSQSTMDSALTFLKKMGTELTYRPDSQELIRLMNRPYRVCGMVKNQGEPGGGPF